ncbi:MAG TPA: TlpA disulfide reductase family protein [Steroidobacteraceae bacterium]|jgi:thiol-disulfide isomerase/thioredoxin|nr:TlpA disulfide reductase family protein [Steroidobacteraceae bacterium]
MNSAGLRYLGAALIVLVGIWLGVKFHLGRHDHEGVSVPAGFASVPDPTEDAALQAADGPHAVVPAKLPDFSLADLAGKPISVSSWNGKSLMINFWATWCAPCQREIPLLKTLAADWAARNLTVVGIAVDYPDKVREFAGRFKIDYPLLVGEQDALDVAAQFGMASPAFPFTVFTDQRGEVVALFVGELHRPQADFILSQVQSLNQDRIQLPEARRAIAEALRALANKPG